MKKIQILFLLLSVQLLAEFPQPAIETEEMPLGLIVAIVLFVVLIIFAFYAGRSKNDVEDGNDSQDTKIDENGKKETAPERMQHYMFAHVVLRDLFFNDRDRLIQDILSKENGLQNFWYQVGDFYASSFDGPKQLDASGIVVETTEFDGRLFAVIQLPKPEQSPEAYFIGLIMPHSSFSKSRYITLEYGKGEGNQSFTVLCEWDGENHLNYGEGCEPTIENFKDTLISMAEVSVKTWDETVSDK
jgi:hypothetical protein